ncbi:hypothetical protein [Amycolatopsis sp. 195334CR]|uniref:hypothetical protein n=1 Tax=Amycolatopsis sp. 195334CR TaxID=2814588 RepID=UPI001A8F6598|nr:hypothetical protein [Amycolatopsis sp. 195334CR]MBN6038600.1 hypothetical protein [Amycolatopsis sp. 195334CR]
MRRVFAAAVFGAALVTLPAGQATAETAACTWQKTAWEIPAGDEVGEIFGYDGSRYAVGVSGFEAWEGEGVWEAKATLWDRGKVVYRADELLPHFRDVNAAGLIVGDTIVDNRFIGITATHDGRTTPLPANPAWRSYSAWQVNNAGDIAGWASNADQSWLVVWPANAPGTYREFPHEPTSLADLDEQGRVLILTSSSEGGGSVLDVDGQWRVLVPHGTATYSRPHDLRDGRVVGASGGSAIEWDAQGKVVRAFGGGITDAAAIGGNGTIAGYGGSPRGVVLWRGGAVVEQPIAGEFLVNGFSDDERTIVGRESAIPTQYHCS